MQRPRGGGQGRRQVTSGPPDRWDAPGEPLRPGRRAGGRGQVDRDPPGTATARRAVGAGRSRDVWDRPAAVSDRRRTPPGGPARRPPDRGGSPRGDGRPASDPGRRGAAPRGDGARRGSVDPRQVWVGGEPGGGGPAGPGRAGRPDLPGGRGGTGGPGGPRHVHAEGEGDDGGAADGRRGRGIRTWPQRLVLGAGVTLVLLCLLGASVGGYALIKYGSIERVNDLSLAQAPKGEPENFLIVAVDTREGHSSKNTDTIMVVRVDPQSDRLALTSFPRDLMVTIADTGRIGMINSAYARDSGGEQVLIDTLRQNFDVTINHFVEVNFESFKEVVDAIGGVSIHMDRAARDQASGFYSEVLGCTTLDGEMGLAFARSRKMDVMIDGEWERDPLSDEHRVLRQQVFVQRAMSKALSQVRSNPLRVRELVDIGVRNVRLDDNLGISDILDLSDQFKDFDPADLETYPMPVLPYPQDPNRLLLDEAEAESSLNVFRGLAPGEIRPGLIGVTVLNGTVADESQQVENLASDVSSALQRVGFDMGAAGDADEFYAATTIQHAPGQELYAQRLARHITSDAAIPIVENADLAPGEVTLIAGADFTTVHEAPTPNDAMPAPAGGDATGEAPAETTTTTGTTGTTVAERPATTTTTENPFILGTKSESAGC
ncbi:MAG TPA: LCP family protein [Acidimicrobiales bacterium]